jgi:DNA invertase Pin-like site-specific DNA recombinase
MYYIYQRISTEKQSLIRQEGAIADYCKANNIEVPEENIYSDVITGKTIKRDKYQEMKAKLVKGDILIMLDLDRLGRNWDLIKNEWKELTDKGVYIIIVNCPLINVLPDSNGGVSIDKRLIQEMMFTLLCYVSQKEVEKVSIRTKESLRVKRDQGIVLGRPPVHTAEQRDEVRRMYGEGKRVSKIAEATGLARSTINRMIEDLR